MQIHVHQFGFVSMHYQQWVADGRSATQLTSGKNVCLLDTSYNIWCVSMAFLMSPFKTWIQQRNTRY